MDNTTVLDSCMNETDSNSSERLPALAAIFTPVFFVLLLVGLVSNLLLLTLLIKASSVQNNINVYLYSMMVNNLISLIPILLLLVATVTREWSFGETICTINQALVYMVRVPFILLHVFISRERYKAVLYFFKWKPYTKWTHLQMAIMWVIAVGSGGIGTLQGEQITGEKWKADIISCYIPNKLVSNDPYLFTGLIVQLVVSFAFNTLSTLFCVFHYGYIFKQLNAIKQLRHQDSTNINLCTDVPIDWSAEVTILKSMASIFSVSFFSVVATMVYYTSVVAVAMVRHSNFANESVPLVYLPLLCVNFLPCLSPVVLLAVNKKFRTRVKDLLHWRLKPNMDHSPVASVQNRGVQNPSNRLSKCFNHQDSLGETRLAATSALQETRQSGEAE